MHADIQIPAVETPGLLIREIRPRDARDFSTYMLREDFQATIATRYSSATEVQKFVARCVRRQALPERSNFHLAAELKVGRQVIGDGFMLLHRPRSAELGWSVHPAMWRRGFGSEIGSALLAIAFEKLGCTAVWAKAFASNTGSIKLMKRIGMTHDRDLPKQKVAPGTTTDVTYYSMKADDYFDAVY
jgi:ribosomal-protein-alanine N-acetyltransferase